MNKIIRLFFSSEPKKLREPKENILLFGRVVIEEDEVNESILETIVSNIQRKWIIIDNDNVNVNDNGL